VINKDTVIAANMRRVAVVMCLASIVWGVAAAWNSGRRAETAELTNG
jgi:hypothetical protein